MQHPKAALTVPQRVFLSLGRMASRLPQVRGKTRVLLELYKLVGLAGRHLSVNAQLRRPVRYAAQLDLHSWLQRVAFLSGGYEADTVAFLLALHEASRRRGYLLDVGANIGLLSIPFALSVRGSGLTAVAVEAVPDNISVLEKNVRMNALDGVVRIIPFGLGDAAGTVEIQVEGDLSSGEGTGTASILPAGSTYECVRQTLRITTLDDLSSGGRVPDGCAVMKIDTDGYDLKVLQGGVEFIRRNRPVIFGEFSAHCLKWHGQTLADVIAFADAHDYDARRRIPGTWTFEPAHADAPFSEDLLLIPRERAGDYLAVSTA